VHGAEQGTAEDSGYTQLVEGVHQDVVLGLEDEHEVEGAADAEGHAIGEAALSEGINQEDGGGGGDGGGVGDGNPRSHAEAVAQFPFASHVAEYADEEVENYQLVRSTVVQPFVKAGGFPDGVEVQSDRVGGGNNSTGDDVVAVHQGTSNGFADAVDVNGRSGDEGDDEADGGGEQGGDHENAEPADVEAVVGAGDPLTEALPGIGAFALLDCCGHGYDDFRFDFKDIYRNFVIPVSLD